MGLAGEDFRNLVGLICSDNNATIHRRKDGKKKIQIICRFSSLSILFFFRNIPNQYIEETVGRDLCSLSGQVQANARQIERLKISRWTFLNYKNCERFGQEDLSGNEMINSALFRNTRNLKIPGFTQTKKMPASMEEIAK